MDTLQALIPLVKPRDDRSFLDHSLSHTHKAEKALDARQTSGHRDVIHPQYLTGLIGQHAAQDAVFTADGGSPMVWCLRHIPSTGTNCTIVSLSHGTMANAMPQALGAQAAYPGRQVISMSGDGGLTMLLGDMLTAVQEELPIKVVVFNNGTLGFVEIEQKVEGLLDTFTELQNPDFGRMAESMGWWGRRIEHPDGLEDAVKAWLAEPGPALLDVVTVRDELVMPPKVEAGQVFGMALYSAKGILSGPKRAAGVVDMLKNTLLP